MGFIILLIVTTLGVAGSAAYFSVHGLAQVFSASFIPVIIMGSALELGKLVGASFLYRFWSSIPFILKVYMLAAVFSLIVVTSAGIFGFLTAAYQTDSIGLKQQQETITLYEGEKASYQSRLDGINLQIEAVPSQYITKRMELISTFDEEKRVILDKITELNAKILDLKTTVLTTEAKIGPIIYVAKVLNRDSDEAVFWFVLLLIFVFDPLAVSLTIAANIAMRRRTESKIVDEPKSEIKICDGDPSGPGNPPPPPSPPLESTGGIDGMASVDDSSESEIKIYDGDLDETSSSPPPSETLDSNEVNDISEEILAIKKLIRDSNKSEDITKLYNVVDDLNTRFKKSQVRSELSSNLRN